MFPWEKIFFCNIRSFKDRGETAKKEDFLQAMSIESQYARAATYPYYFAEDVTFAVVMQSIAIASYFFRYSFSILRNSL